MLQNEIRCSHCSTFPQTFQLGNANVKTEHNQTSDPPCRCQTIKKQHTKIKQRRTWALKLRRMRRRNRRMRKWGQRRCYPTPALRFGETFCPECLRMKCGSRNQLKNGRGGLSQCRRRSWLQRWRDHNLSLSFDTTTNAIEFSVDYVSD
jgi:hypothetical protein